MSSDRNDSAAPQSRPAPFPSDPGVPVVPSFALWLAPRGEERALWTRRIAGVAKLLGGPVFAPHATLFGTFRRPLPDALVLAEALSRDLAPIRLRGSGLGLRPDRWQALFVPLALTPELWRARCSAGEVLAPGERVEFFPHLSLFYGELSAAQRSAAFDLLDSTTEVDWMVHELTLVSVDGPPERWSVEAILPLRG